MHSTSSRLGSLTLLFIILLIAQGSVYGASFSQDQKLTSADFTIDTILNQPMSRYGYAVAISGNWMASGKPGKNGLINDPNPGSVYIYERVAGTWEYRTVLFSPTPQAGDDFGSAVDIYEESGIVTVIIGAPLYDAAYVDQGRAFVFTDSNATAAVNFSITTAINNISPEFNAQFGHAVALYADTAAISRPNYGDTDSGMVTIYRRNAGGSNAWGIVANKSGNPGNGFGESVDVHGEYVIIGAPYASNVTGLKTGQVYVYGQDQGGANTWGIKHTLTPASAQANMSFGFAVGIWDSDTSASNSPSRSVIGAPLFDESTFTDSGSVIFFSDNTINFTYATPTGSNVHQGYSVAIDGDNAIAGRPSQLLSGQQLAGQVNTFSYNGTVWATNTINLTQTGASAGYYYGHAVDVSGTVAVIGGPGSRESALLLPPGAIQAGVVETLVKSGVVWAKDVNSYVRASFDQPNTATIQHLGYSMAVTDNWLAIGVPNDGQKGANAGAVYMYQNTSGFWTPHSKVTALFGAENDGFGTSVALHGTKLVVGAPRASGFPDNTAEAGAAYIYDFNGTVWLQVVARTSPNPTVSGSFGHSVDIHGDVVVVGAFNENGGGRIYAYRALDSLDNGITINVAGLNTNDQIGFSVSVYDPAPGTPNNEIIAAGAPGRSSVFVLSGATFATTLEIPDPDGSTNFGYDVAIFNNRLAVGSPTSGKAYVYSDTNYSAVETITPAVPAPSFGTALDLDDNALIVGAPNSHSGAGSSNIYIRNGTTWAGQDLIQPADVALGDAFGSSVAMSNGMYLIGAPLQHANGINGSGAAYMFVLTPEVTLSESSLSVSETGPTTDTTVVALNRAPDTNVTIQLTFGTDIQVDTGSGFGASPQTITLTPANAVTGVTVSVRAVDDAIHEANPESVTITTSATASASPSFFGLEVDDITVEVEDNDSVTVDFQSSTFSIGESAGAYSVNAVINIPGGGTLAEAVTLDVATTLGTAEAADFNLVTTQVTYPVGTAHNAVIAVNFSTVDDQLLEGDETFTATLSPVSGPVTSSVVLTTTITDNEAGAITFDNPNTAVSEGAGTLNVPVRLTITGTGTGPVQLESALDVAITNTAGTAVTPADYTASTVVTFAAAQNSPITGSVTGTITDDTLVEADEIFLLGFGATTPLTVPSTGTNTVTITENDSVVVAFAADDDIVAENVGTFSKNLSLSFTTNPSGTGSLQDALIIPLTFTETSASEPEDFTLAANVTFPAGSTGATVLPATATIINDSFDENDEVFAINLTTSGHPPSVTFGRSSTNVTITDDDSVGILVTQSSGTTVIIEGGLTDSYTVVLTSEPSATVVVHLAFDPTQIMLNGDVDGSLDLTFTTGNWNTSQGVSVVAVDDTLVEANPHSTIITQTATSADPTYAAINPDDVTVTIIENDSQEIVFAASNSSTSEGAGTHGLSARLLLTTNGTPGGTINSDMIATVNVTPVSASAADFTVTTTSVVFATGSPHNSTQSVFMNIADDLLLEGNETFTLSFTLTTSTGTAIGTHTVTITDNEMATIAFDTAASSVGEGDGNSNVPVTLTIMGTGTGILQLANPVSVVVADTPGTAIAADYSLTTTSVNFAAGVNSPIAGTIVSAIVNDVQVENDETYALTFGALTGPSSIVVSIAQHTVTITENDTAEFAFTSNDNMVAEADAYYAKNVVLTITADGTGGTPRLQNSFSIPVSFTEITANQPEDFTLSTIGLVYSAGSISGTSFVVDGLIVDDSIDEGDETFSIQLSSINVTPYITLGRSTTQFTIIDNDVAGVSVTESDGTTAITEGGANDSYTVVLTSAPTATVTVNLAFDPAQVILNGDSAGLLDLTFTTSNWNTAQTVTVDALNDTVVEGADTTLIAQTTISSDATYSNIATADVNVSITDNDTAEIIFSSAGYAASEGAYILPGATLKVTGNGAPGGSIADPIVVAMSLVLGTAEADDVTISNAQVTLSGGLPHDSIVFSHAITITNDLIVERAEDFTVNLSIVSGEATTTASNTYSIISDDAAVITYANATSAVAEATTPHIVNAQLALSGTGTGPASIEEPITVTITETAGSAATPADYTLSTTSITFAAGSGNNATLPISSAVVNDNLIETPETFALGFGTVVTDLLNVSTTGTHTVMILDNDIAGVTIIESGGNTSVTEGIGSDTFTVTLNAEPASDVTITFDVGAQVTFAPNPLVITPANWNVPQQVTVTAVDDVMIEGAHNAVVGLTFTGDTNFAAITPNSINVAVNIIDNDIPGVIITQTGGSTDVVEGGLTDTYDVVLLGAPSQDVTITLNSGTQLITSASSLVFTPANYNIPQTVTVTAIDDFTYEGVHTGTITHTVTSADINYNGFAVGSITVNITDGVIELLANGSFEIAGANPRKAQGWNAGEMTDKDRRLCADITTTDGSCAWQYRFNGPTNVARVIRQKIVNPAWGNAGDVLLFSAQVSANNLTSGARFVALVTYTDGTSEKMVAPVPVGSYAYTTVSQTFAVTKRIQSVKFKIKAGAASGRLWIDDVSLLFSGTSSRGAVETGNTDILPMPQAPEGWRR